MLTTIIHIIPENVIMSLTNDSDSLSANLVLQNSELLLSLLDDNKAFTTTINMSGFGKGALGEQGPQGEKGDKGEDARTMINDNTISTTDVWSSAKTNEEINKLLPLIYAGL